MDELVHHCLRELSFDGDLGCNVSRLQDFITGFYDGTASGAQVIDDDFCAFVWSILMQNPTVRVGIVPLGISSEVYIAPQNSAKRKAQSNGEEHVEASPPNLALIPDARQRLLGDLRAEFGDALRIAVDPETSFAAITGSHVRPSKLTPMVYSALQLITRGREEGISTVELGKKTTYDQKTCFYLIKQLQELDLVVKVRRGGVGNHCCIHKFFVQRSSFWQQLRAEETALEKKAAEGLDAAQEDGESDADEDQVPAIDLQFEAIDSRHLSSLILVRSRLVKLLKASKNYMHPSNNLLVAIGFGNPTKTDRRFFQTRLRELISQGTVERILVPSSKHQNRMVKCIRLLDTNATEPPESSTQSGNMITEVNPNVTRTDFEVPGVKCNRTLYKQIIDLIEASGSAGMTLHEICSSLGNFDKRTVELILARASKSLFPSHLSDLGIADVMETFGRERRHRFYTLAAYRTVMESEQLNDSTSAYGSVDLSNARGFIPVEPGLFYSDAATLLRHQDTYVGSTQGAKTQQKAASKSKKRKQTDGVSIDDNGPSASSRPRKKVRTQELDPPSEPAVKDVAQPQPTPKKRGRPRKNPERAEEATEESRPKKRGRPRKESLSAAHASTANVDDNQTLVKEAPASSPKDQAIEKQQRRSQRTRKGLENTSVLDASENQRQHNQSLVKEGRMTGERSCNALPPVNDRAEDLDIFSSNGAEASSSALPAVTDIPIDPALIQIPVTGTALDTDQLPVNDALSVAKTATAKARHRAREGRATRVNLNISHLRRENELLRVIRESGGIVSLHTKAFLDAHLALLDTLFKDGEATSAPPGTRLDKRTVENAIKNMENSGSIKVLKTSVMSHTGANRQTIVLYLPDLPQETINEYLRHLSQNAPAYNIPHIKTYEEPIDFGRDGSVTQRSALPLQLLQKDDPGDDPEERWTKNIARAEQLFAYDADTIRQVLLTERTTIAQLYGYIVAKALRTRDFHLFSVGLFSPEVSSDNVVSKEHRIVHVSYYYQDISLAQYCAFVSVLSDDTELKQCLDRGGGQGAVRDYPQFDTSLQPGRSRCRSRLLDLLMTLHSLGIVTPLRPADAAEAEISCTSATHPSAYKTAPLHGWTTSTPQTAPQYWKFAASAPIYLWALSDTLPPLWKEMPVSTGEEITSYWKELQEVCLNREYAESIICPVGGATDGRRPGIGAARTLRRKASWDHTYLLTWHQKQFMNNVFRSDLSTSEMEDTVQQICYVTSAPRQTVADYLSNPKRAARRDAKGKNKVQTEEDEAQRDVEGRENLRVKAQQIKRQREQGWNDLLQRIHPEPIEERAIVRVRAVRSRFLQSGSTKNVAKWEKEVREALDQGAVAKVIAGPSRARRFKPLNATKPFREGLESLNDTSGRTSFQQIPPPLASNSPEKSVEQLIAQQGTPLDPQAHKKIRRKAKGKGKEKASEEDTEDISKARRPKFHWTREYDELVRDASAIIRARCRVTNRSDLSAYDQVFPSIPRNSVRQRVTHLRENPVDDSYQKRLEDRWYELWSRYRGTDFLPDEDPFSPSNFNLPNHIEFLRKHVDKNAIRIGFVERKHTITLPASVDEILQQYGVTEEETTAPDWDFLWNTHIDEGREKVFSQQAFGTHPDFSPQAIAESEDLIAVAEAAVKMVFSTPNERYDSERASQLLYSAGEQAVSVAIPNLLRRGVLSKLVRDPKKPKPGRTFKISEINQNALGGTIPQDTFENAVVLPDVLSEDEWADWPLVVEDGDVAGILQLLSDDKVDFNFDLNQKHEARENLDFNSKKADDEDIEVSIQVRLKLTPEELPSVLEPSPAVESGIVQPTGAADDDRHGHTRDGEEATCCRKASCSLVDCSACMDENIAKLTAQMSSHEVLVALQIAQIVREAGQHGISKEDLEFSVANNGQDIWSVVDKMVTAPSPLLFWAGYSTATLISCDYLRAWTVVTNDSLKTRTFPRRWLDVKGVKVTTAWEAALRAVIGVVLFRPGISQFELRWRLRAVYDHQEIAELVQHLEDGGFLEARVDSATFPIRDSLGTSQLKSLGDDEGRHMFWFVVSGKERFWYELV